jgi:hypothetical protein
MRAQANPALFAPQAEQSLRLVEMRKQDSIDATTGRGKKLTRFDLHARRSDRTEIVAHYSTRRFEDAKTRGNTPFGLQREKKGRRTGFIADDDAHLGIHACHVSNVGAAQEGLTKGGVGRVEFVPGGCFDGVQLVHRTNEQG